MGSESIEWLNSKDTPYPFLISATAGTGKTVLIQRITHILANEWISDPQKPVPLYYVEVAPQSVHSLFY